MTTTCRIESGGPELATTAWRPDGLPAVLVHGFAHNRHVWDHVVPELDAALRPIAFDLRGHGDSDWSIAGDYAIEHHADDIARVFDAFDIERGLLIGHSLGGHAATCFAGGHPDRVAGLVLVDSGPNLSNDAVARLTLDVDASLRSYADVDEFVESLTAMHLQGDRRVLRRLAETSLHERFDRRFEPRLDPLLIEAALRVDGLASIEAEMWNALERVVCPTLLVRGGSSAMLSEAAALEMTRTRLADAELVTLPRAGHAVMVDDGPGLVHAINDFAKGRLGHGALPHGASSVRSGLVAAGSAR